MKANHKLVSAEVVTLNTVSLKDDFITTAPPFIAPTAVSCRVSVLPWQSRLMPGQETSMMTVACVAD